MPARKKSIPKVAPPAAPGGSDAVVPVLSPGRDGHLVSAEVVASRIDRSREYVLRAARNLGLPHVVRRRTEAASTSAQNIVRLFDPDQAVSFYYRKLAAAPQPGGGQLPGKSPPGGEKKRGGRKRGEKKTGGTPVSPEEPEKSKRRHRSETGATKEGGTKEAVLPRESEGESDDLHSVSVRVKKMDLLLKRAQLDRLTGATLDRQHLVAEMHRARRRFERALADAGARLGVRARSELGLDDHQVISLRAMIETEHDRALQRLSLGLESEDAGLDFGDDDESLFDGESDDEDEGDGDGGGGDGGGDDSD